MRSVVVMSLFFYLGSGRTARQKLLPYQRVCFAEQQSSLVTKTSLIQPVTFGCIEQLMQLLKQC